MVVEAVVIAGVVVAVVVVVVVVRSGAACYPERSHSKHYPSTCSNTCAGPVL